MAVLAVFGIENDGLNLAVNLLLLFLVVIYVALIYWTWADARRRIDDPMLVGCATAASLFPFIGTIIYLIVRPPEFLDDVRERELEMAAAEARLATLDQLQCPHCGFDVEKAFLRCPSCLRRLKEPCTVCGKPLDPRWKICPYCEAEVGAPAEPRRPRARRSTAASRPARPQAVAQTRPPDETEEITATGNDKPHPSESGPRRGPRAPECIGAQPAKPAASARPDPRRSMDRTLILVKPDAFERALTGEILARFERKGLRIAAMKQMTVERSWPSATTPSTASGRSSASSWPSSPVARWWRWCSRGTRRSWPPAS